MPIYLGSTDAMDVYEEGGFDVAYTSGGGSVTIHPSVNRMSYTKIGRVVYVTGRTVIQTINSPTGALTLTGLPFTSADLTEESELSYFTFQMGGTGLDIAANAIQGSNSTGGTTIIIREFDGTTAADLAGKIGDDTDIGITGWYIAA